MKKESDSHPDYTQNIVDNGNEDDTRSPSLNYEMRQGGRRQDTAALKTYGMEGYGATTTEEQSVARLLQAEQQSQIEILNSRRSQALNNQLQSDSHPFSWLTKILSAKGKQKQPHNPYQEICNDREVMRMLKRKKSMGSLKSRPRFCT